MFMFALYWILEGVENFQTGDHRIRGTGGGRTGASGGSGVLFAHPEWASAACIAFGLLLIYGGIRMWINDEE